MSKEERSERERARCREKYPKYYQANREEVRRKVTEKYHAAREASPVMFLRRSAKYRARKKELPFDLTVEHLESIWTGRCAITDLPMRVSKGNGPGIFSPSIDRIVPELGYVAGNVRFVIHAVNSMKNNGTDEDVVMIARAIVTNFTSSRGC